MAAKIIRDTWYEDKFLFIEAIQKIKKLKTLINKLEMLFKYVLFLILIFFCIKKISTDVNDYYLCRWGNFIMCFSKKRK